MTIDSPVGPLTIVLDEAGRLAELRFHRGEENRQPPTANCQPVIDQLTEYFAGKRKNFDIELAMRGTEFQLDVWNELTRIPYGDTISYSDLARRIGRPAAIRAVGAANGANPIPVIVPCHRVIGANGSLTGYGGGIERKQWLLALEGRRLF
ncbi:MAG TPA: methylated-DNA--[protein]-cysteine S-methyltransferase [Thermoanaerobaculia bacterium]